MLTLTPFAGFGVAFLRTLALTPYSRPIARWLGAVDRRTADKIHARDVPRLGGLAIAAGFFVPVLVLALRNNLFSQGLYGEPRRIITLLAGAVAILALGVFDDARGATAAKKLSVQIPIAAVTWWAGIRIGGVGGFGGELVVLPAALSLALTIAWIVGVTNAVNLIDGLDGLASGIVLQALAATALCAWHRGEPALVMLAICLAGSVAGFLVHNFPPATVFMGDSGSMFLGYVVAVASMWSSQKGATAIGIVLPTLALGVPLLDTGLAIVRRLAAGKPVFKGDLDHIHHRLLALGWTQRQAVLVLYCVGLFFSALSMALVYVNDRRLQWPAIGGGVVAAIGFARWLSSRRAMVRRRESTPGRLPRIASGSG